MRIHLSGTRRISASPANTTGTLASIMPIVVPNTTRRWNETARPAPRSRSASCRPSRPGRMRPPWSGTRRSAARRPIRRARNRESSVQAAIAMNDSPRIQRIASAPMTLTSQLPTALASAWFASVATKMPSTMGHGRAKARRQQQRQQLGLVADLGQRDDAGRRRAGLPSVWMAQAFDLIGAPYRIRTGVTALRGPCPGPLDEGSVYYRRVQNRAR